MLSVKSVSESAEGTRDVKETDAERFSARQAGVCLK